MGQQLKRVRLNSLTDIQKMMGILFKEARTGLLSSGDLTTYSQHLKRLHDMKIQETEADIAEEMAGIHQQLADIEAKR